MPKTNTWKPVVPYCNPYGPTNLKGGEREQQISRRAQRRLVGWFQCLVPVPGGGCAKRLLVGSNV